MLFTCLWCGVEFRDKPSHADRKYCSRSCKGRADWADRPEGNGYRYVKNPNHPLADSKGVVREHRAVLYDHIGPGTHPCNWCGVDVTWRSVRDGVAGTAQGVLVVDHLDRNKRNNDLANLVPSCHTCNTWRDPPQPPIRAGELFVVMPNGARARAVERTCQKCGSVFLFRKSLRSPGRYCSQTCRYA